MIKSESNSEKLDLNLLLALEVLLAEANVTRAAARLGLSASAMSRTLARLRAATGDELLVRAGRNLALTPRGSELRDQVPGLFRQAAAVLRPKSTRLDLASLRETYTIRANESFVEIFAARLIGSIAMSAPNVCIRFVPKSDKDAARLREGHVDLEIGVIGTSAPEIRTRMLFQDEFVGAVRRGHPLLSGETITAHQYASCDHVITSRKGAASGPVDDALATLGLRRRVRAVVPSFSQALRIARESDLVALVPRMCVKEEQRKCGDSGIADTVGFRLPVDVPKITISAMWHPRLNDDAGHRWIRELVASTCSTNTSL